MIGASKTFPIKPSGLMDFRSDAGDIMLGDARVMLNISVTEQGKPIRSPQWRKLFGNSSFGFNNQDLHDQLLDDQKYYQSFNYIDYFYDVYAGYYDYAYCGGQSFTRDGCREAVLFMHEMISEFGARRLLAFTQKRIYELNEHGGNWRLLADGLGSLVRNNSEADCVPCAGPRWLATQLLGYVMATNGVDPVLSYKMGDGPDGCELWSARQVNDLDALGITRVGVVQEFKGFILAGDVEEDGVRYPGRIYWSDFNEPLSWLPLPGTSLASYSNVGFSDKVLRIEPLGDYVMIYTDAAIYRGQLNIQLDANQVAQKVFDFTRIYEGPHALHYKYSMINTGTEHLYASSDGIYVIDNPFSSAPRRVEWIHRASGAIYHGATRWSAEFQSLPADIASTLQFGPINQRACDNFIGYYDAIRKEAWFSWPTDANVCPNVSLRLNLQYQASGLVDHGFTAFGTYRSDTRVTFEQWLSDLQVCPSSTWNNIKQGDMTGETSDFPFPLPYIWNETEDPSLPSHKDSMCARLGNTTIDDLCGGCQLDPILIGASAEDLTLKEFDDALYAREMYNGTDYTMRGYPSLLQSGAVFVGTELEKVFSGMTAEYKALPQTTPSQLSAQAGFGPQGSCPTWRSVGSRALKCLTEKTRQQHETDRTRPDLSAKFPFLYRGIALWYRLFVTGTGGGTSLDRVDVKVRNAQTIVS